jgi:hypothetical protein
MMSPESVSKRVFLRRSFPLCITMACAILTVLPIGLLPWPGSPKSAALRPKPRSHKIRTGRAWNPVAEIVALGGFNGEG